MRRIDIDKFYSSLKEIKFEEKTNKYFLYSINTTIENINKIKITGIAFFLLDKPCFLNIICPTPSFNNSTILCFLLLFLFITLNVKKH